MNLVFYVFIHFLFHLLPPRHLIHHYLSQQQPVSILVFMHLCLHTFPFSPTFSTTSYSPLSVTKQRVSYYCVYESSLLCLHTFPFSPTSSTTSYSPLSVATTDCKYSCVYASKCLHTFPFSPTSSTTSYSPLQQQDVSILVFMHLCLHTFPFSPTSSTTSYSPLSVTKQGVSYYCVYESCLHTFPFSPTSSTTSYSLLSVTTTACKYSCVYESMSSYIYFFTYFLHDILFTTQQQPVSILVFMHLCLHTFPFSPTSSTTSYSPLSVTTTGCKYSCVYASKCLYTFPFSPIYFLHDILFTTICHKTGSKLCVYESNLLCLHTFPFSPTSSNI